MAARSASLRVTSATADITPRNATKLAGFTNRDARFVEVATPLEANGLAVQLSATRWAAILTLDTLFIGPTLTATLTEHFARRHRQAASDLLILASHTHFAPALDETKPALGQIDPAYSSLVADRCKTLIDRLLQLPATAGTIRLHRGSSNAAINRRKRWAVPHLCAGRTICTDAVMAPNPHGPFDPTIRGWIVTDEAGEVLAVLWCYACHPTGFPQLLQVSSDYPGVVRDRLRIRFGRGTPVLFLQGFAGDVRPRVPESRSVLVRAWKTLAFGPSFDAFTVEGWMSWAAMLASDVERAFDGLPESEPGQAERESEIGSASRSLPLARIVDGETGDRAVIFRRLRLAPTLDIVAIGAEPLTGLQEFVALSGTTPVGYLGDVFGYWPTDLDARSGGYEVSGFQSAFGLRGRLRLPLNQVFQEATSALAQLQ